MSVVGFDDIPESASFLPALTTVHQDFAGVGRLCVEEVLSKMREGAGGVGGVGEGGYGTTLVPTRLVRRRSTAPPPGDR